MAPENDGWDPEHPDKLRATGWGVKAQGGWRGPVLGLLAVGLALLAWFLWGREP